jgi:hypothetical protein
MMDIFALAKEGPGLVDEVRAARGEVADLREQLVATLEALDRLMTLVRAMNAQAVQTALDVRGLQARAGVL